MQARVNGRDLFVEILIFRGDLGEQCASQPATDICRIIECPITEPPELAYSSTVACPYRLNVPAKRNATPQTIMLLNFRLPKDSLTGFEDACRRDCEPELRLWLKLNASIDQLLEERSKIPVATYSKAN